MADEKREPWVNFSEPQGEVDHVILLRPDRQERVHVYRRPDGTFGRRNFVWVADDFYSGWTVGRDWGHRYDSIRIALKESRGDYPWVEEYF